MQRIAAAPLGSFLVTKKLPENAFYRSDAAKAKRRLHNLVHATRLQLSLGVRTIRHERAFICLLSAKLGRIFIVKQPDMY